MRIAIGPHMERYRGSAHAHAQDGLFSISPRSLRDLCRHGVTDVGRTDGRAARQPAAASSSGAQVCPSREGLSVRVRWRVRLRWRNGHVQLGIKALSTGQSKVGISSEVRQAHSRCLQSLERQTVCRMLDEAIRGVSRSWTDWKFDGG